MRDKLARLSIFSDRDVLATESTPHAVILVPFWGPNPEAPGDPEAGRFDRYAAIGSSFLHLTSLADCDIAVFPQNWETAGERATELGEAFVSLCDGTGKRPVFFAGSDSAEPLPVEGVVFRTSLSRSRRLPDEYALPAWSEDFLSRHLGGELHPRRKQKRPLVGFCGNPMAGVPAPTIGARVRGVLGAGRPEPARELAGEHPRTLALRALARDERLRADFVLRSGFWGHRGLADRARTRREYVQNMVESDYVLCARGVGNFSYRLYETLSAGRIPVFVDTDCVLPLDFDIAWRDYCVWVDERDIERIGDRVLEFHESLSPVEFEERQRACRRLWETHISPEGFFSQFHRHFELA